MATMDDYLRRITLADKLIDSKRNQEKKDMNLHRTPLTRQDALAIIHQVEMEQHTRKIKAGLDDMSLSILNQ